MITNSKFPARNVAEGKSCWQIPASRRSGFTMMEISIVVGIVAVISVVAVAVLFRERGAAELSSATREVVSMLREAQSRAINQEENTVWGVRFENATATAPFYALFKTSFSDANVLKRRTLPRRIQFSGIAEGGSLEVTFAQITGIPSSPVSIGLDLMTGGTGPTAENVSRESSGKIFFDDFNRANL